MNWQIDYSKDSLKFIDKHNIEEDDIIEYLSKATLKLKGENINIDLKKMKGEWKGFYRIRSGNIRIIFNINFENYQIYIDRIDFRGDVYK